MGNKTEMKKLVNKTTGEKFEYNPEEWEEEKVYEVGYTWEKANKELNHFNHHVRFTGTKQQCEEYIQENKPLYSRSQLLAFASSMRNLGWEEKAQSTECEFKEFLDTYKK